jgi:hypothetical protein
MKAICCSPKRDLFIENPPPGHDGKIRMFKLQTDQNPGGRSIREGSQQWTARKNIIARLRTFYARREAARLHPALASHGSASCVWMMDDRTWKTVKKLKDTAGPPPVDRPSHRRQADPPQSAHGRPRRRFEVGPVRRFLQICDLRRDGRADTSLHRFADARKAPRSVSRPGRTPTGA